MQIQATRDKCMHATCMRVRDNVATCGPCTHTPAIKVHAESSSQFNNKNYKHAMASWHCIALPMSEVAAAAYACITTHSRNGATSTCTHPMLPLDPRP